jgi:hypothetical protein
MQWRHTHSPTAKKIQNRTIKPKNHGNPLLGQERGHFSSFLPRGDNINATVF